MKTNEIIERSVSYGILRFLFSCIFKSYSYTTVKRFAMPTVKIIKNAFMSSESRRQFYFVCARCRNDFYAVAQLTLCVILLCHLALDSALRGKISYSGMIALTAMMLMIYAAKKGLFANLSDIVRNSVTYRILSMKII